MLEGISKLQNFAVYLEGSRVPLELSVDTSVLVGQKVFIKYIPGPCEFKVSCLHVCALMGGQFVKMAVQNTHPPSVLSHYTAL